MSEEIKREKDTDHIEDEERDQETVEGPTGKEVAEMGTRPEEPDVLLDVPRVKVDEISLEVDDLRARVSLHAAVGNLVALDVGADVHIGRVNLTIKGVEAQALLKVRLEKVYSILARTLTTIDNNPELLASLLRPVGETIGAVGRTVEKTVPDLGRSLGRTVEETVPDVGKAVSRTVEETVPEVGKAAGRTVENTVPGLGQAVGRTTERAAADLGEATGDTVKRAVSEVGETITGSTRQAATTVPGTEKVDETMERVDTAEAAGESPPAPAEGEVEKLEREQSTSAEKHDEPDEMKGGKAGEPRLLFDGSEESFRDWKAVGDCEIIQRGEELVLTAGGELGLAYFTGHQFSDFSLHFRFRPEAENFEVSTAVRFLDPQQKVPDRDTPSIRYSYDNQAFVAPHTGFEVQLGSQQRPGGDAGTFNGILLGDAPGAQEHAERAEVKDDDWNDLALEAKGDLFRVRLNGKETARFTNPDNYRGKPANVDPHAGFIGFLVRKGRVALSRIMVEERTYVEKMQAGEAELASPPQPETEAFH